MSIQPDLSRLKSQLLVSGLQQKDNPLFQVVNGLIDNITRIQDLTNDDITVINNTINSSVVGEQINIPNYAFLGNEFEESDSFYLPPIRNFVGGSDTQVQFNDGGGFGGDAGLTYDKTNDILIIDGRIRVGNGTNVAPGLGFKDSTFDGFYRVSTGVVVYTSNGTPAVLLAGGLNLDVNSSLRWAPNSNLPGSFSSNLMDVGLNRSAVGIVKVIGGDVSAKGTIQIGQPGTRPTAAVAFRGTFWIEEGGVGVADIVYICIKNASDVYNWIQFAP